MKIRNESKASFDTRAEAVDFAAKALGNPANDKVWYTEMHWQEDNNAKWEVTVASNIKT